MAQDEYSLRKGLKGPVSAEDFFMFWYLEYSMQYWFVENPPPHWYVVAETLGWMDKRLRRIVTFYYDLNHPTPINHPPIDRWLDAALIHPLPEAPLMVRKSYYRRMYLELTEQGEKFLACPLIDNLSLQTRFDPAFSVDGKDTQFDFRGSSTPTVIPVSAPLINEEELTHPGPGRMKSPKISERNSTVRKMMITPSNFADSTKVKTLFEQLDHKSIPLPEWRGTTRMWQPEKWCELLQRPKSPEYRRRIALLKRALYPRGQN
jgi:hypothetical protein